MRKVDVIGCDLETAARKACELALEALEVPITLYIPPTFAFDMPAVLWPDTACPVRVVARAGTASRAWIADDNDQPIVEIENLGK